MKKTASARAAGVEPMAFTWSERKSRFQGYLVAVVAVGGGVLFRSAFDPLLHSKAPLMVFVLSVLGAALYGGLWAGVAATVLSTLAIDFFFLDPRFALGWQDASDFSALGLFVLVGLAASILVHRLHRANRAALDRQARLDAAARDRAASLYARSLLEASLDPLVTISPDGKVTDVNRATELVTGLKRERLIGSRFSDYVTEPEKAEAGYQKALAEGFVQDYPLTIRHASGRTTDVLYNAVVYRNETGQVQGVFAAARDVTERKRAEAELARYRDHLEELVQQRTSELETSHANLQRTTAELARSNQELEQFAYVASHDLQEPLRGVSGYLALLRQRWEDKLEDEDRRYISGATQGAARMHALINGVLALSRVGTQGQAFQAADLNPILDQALEGLRVGVEEAGATITRDPLPTLPVDAGQMAQLFQNLIGNALKFRGERAPEIHVTAQQQPGQWVLGVRDNGIGIEPQYHQRVFLIFQRLHSRNAYPGTGIGLAICKKIVERHGGTIWIESQAGKGSTFYFTLPTGEIS